MSYVGNWKFHSIASRNENDELVYLSAEEYLKAPMPYVDESDEEAAADELRERRKMTGARVKVCEDGKLYFLMPLPEGVSQEEIDQAVSSGAITLIDGMMANRPAQWQERDGGLWYEASSEGLGENGDPWVKGIDSEGFFVFAGSRFVKE